MPAKNSWRCIRNEAGFVMVDNFFTNFETFFKTRIKDASFQAFKLKYGERIHVSARQNAGRRQQNHGKC